MTDGLAPNLAADLQPRLAALQRGERLPAVAAAVGRGGTLLFEGSAGKPKPEPDTQFRIGSISKTFTAVLIMQLRDEGRVRLDDTLDQYVTGTLAGHLTLRMLLSHTSGITAEPAGPFWEATGRTRDELIGGIRPVDLVLEPGQNYHYSNVGFALLGLVVEQVREQSWQDALNERILQPLGLTRTTYAPSAPFAQGWRVHPYANTLQPEPHADTGAMAPAGQIWSTPGDLVRWGTFLADPDPAVLRPDTIAEMSTPVTPGDNQQSSYGLGLDIVRYGDRMAIGHGGSMPGFSARLSVLRKEKVAAALVTNAWGGRQGNFIHEAIEAVLTSTDVGNPWQTEATPNNIIPLLGAWWYRGLPMVLSYRSGGLYLSTSNAQRPPVRFEQLGPDLFRATSGAMLGEHLQVVRDEQGVPVVLDINTWLLVRTFDDPRGGP